MDRQPSVSISPGTQVVAGQRGTGVVVSATTAEPVRYLVRFPSGEQLEFDRGELLIRKEVQAASLGPPLVDSDTADEILRDWLVFRCVTGSRAYGLEQEGSDTDVRGVFVAPPVLLWSLRGAPEYLERQDQQEAFWELRKFCVLALKANPNVLECVYSPIVELVTTTGERLLDLRQAFLSRLVHQTFNGYVLSQFKKLERDLRQSGEPKWKHVMHLIRLLLSGIAVLRTGTMQVRVSEERERLLAVRKGELAWDEIERWRLSLHGEFDAALAASPLPKLPDYQRVEGFLIEVRRSTAQGGRP